MTSMGYHLLGPWLKSVSPKSQGKYFATLLRHSPQDLLLHYLMVNTAKAIID